MQAQRFAAFTARTLDDIGTTTSPECRQEAQDFHSGCTRITMAAQSVAGNDLEALHLTFSCAAGIIMNVTLLEAEDTGDLTMISVSPLEALPECAQSWIKHGQSRARTKTDPANPEEAYEFAKENSGTGAAVELGRTDAERMDNRRQQGAHVHFAARVSGRQYVRHGARAHLDTSQFLSGDLTTKQDVNATLANFVPREHERVYADSLPNAYSPFDGTPCLRDYAPRQQGSCGSCYAFAASTAMALQACVAKARAGVNAANQPMLTAQGLVSCGSTKAPAGSSRKYSSGCDGGSGPMAFQYIIDHGITTVGCWPYQQSSGSFQNHFSSNSLSLAQCRSSCVPQSKSRNRHLTSGIPRGSSLTFDSEANIAAAMKSFGALYCRFDVYSSFMQYKGGVYMGRSGGDRKKGGHAVTCYGFGTTSDGTPYWDCINSWGASWGIAPKGTFKMLRKSGTPSDSDGLITSCTIAPVDYADLFPSGSVPSPPPYFCADAKNTGLYGPGNRQATCSQVASHCNGMSISPSVRSSCPATCKPKPTSKCPSWCSSPPWVTTLSGACSACGGAPPKPPPGKTTTGECAASCASAFKRKGVGRVCKKKRCRGCAQCSSRSDADAGAAVTAEGIGGPPMTVPGQQRGGGVLAP